MIALKGGGSQNFQSVAARTTAGRKISAGREIERGPKDDGPATTKPPRRLWSLRWCRDLEPSDRDGLLEIRHSGMLA